jgi:ATP-dependent DNA helicase RecQ
MELEVATSALVTEQVDAAARALAARWRGGDPADPALRRACTGSLVELRGAYRQNPAAFSASTVRLLKDLSSALTATQVQATLALPGARPRPPGAPSPQDVLRDVFGYESFRAGQQEIIDAVLAGRDCVGIMPTGAGKSLTYQIPARILGGLTLVV